MEKRMTHKKTTIQKIVFAHFTFSALLSDLFSEVKGPQRQSEAYDRCFPDIPG
jgi:hypothetical protein